MRCAVVAHAVCRGARWLVGKLMPTVLLCRSWINESSVLELRYAVVLRFVSGRELGLAHQIVDAGLRYSM